MRDADLAGKQKARAPSRTTAKRLDGGSQTQQNRSVRSVGPGYTERMKVRVLAVPNSRVTEIVGWEDDPRSGRVLRVRIAAPPVDGKANEALRDALAAHLGLAKSQVHLEKGAGSRIKTFGIPDGMDLG
jgi:uncharacterized protein YggU (UPF0235/DUF167 family)